VPTTIFKDIQHLLITFLQGRWLSPKE
jgi:hypothetical protein